MAKGPYRKIGARFDRVRTEMNDNMDDIWSDIQAIDTNSRNTITTAQEAKKLSESSKEQSDRAEKKADRVRAELDEVISDGNSNAEVAASRIASDGVTKGSLPERILYEVDNLNDKITQRSFSVMDFGAIGDGLADDSLSIANAINTIPDYSTLILPKNHLIDSEITISNKKFLKLVSVGNVVLKKNLNFSNCPGLMIEGNFSGNTIPKSSIEVVDKSQKKLVLSDASDFEVGNQITVFTEDHYDICRYPGSVIAKEGNTITVDYNRIYSNDPFNNILPGQDIYVTASEAFNKTIKIERSNGIVLSGKFDVDIVIHNSNYSLIKDVTSRNGEINLEFCYGTTISNVTMYEPHFYGIFLLGSRKVNCSNIQIKKPYFSGFVIKSVWDCNLSNINIFNAAIHGIQMIRNTISNPTTPSRVNPLCQDNLTVSRLNTLNVEFEKCNISIMVTTDCDNTQFLGITSNDCWGNVLLVNQTNADTLFSNIKISNHAMVNPTTFTSNIPLLLTGKRIRVSDVSINGCRAISPLRAINCESAHLSDFMFENTKGAFYLQSSENVIVQNLLSKNQVETSDVVFLTGSNRNVTINAVNITNSPQNVNANKLVNITGSFDNVSLKSINIEGENPKGIFSEGVGRGLQIESSVIRNSVDAIYVANVTGVQIQRNHVQGAYNGIMLGPSTTDIICKDNIIRSTVKVLDNSSSASKIITDNLLLNPTS
ncbi:hypothetical protein [Shouchella hunanensis]|uniref:Pectate lyase-like protein n=1 Tax=Shouchella hunanensis TaxID=766894 RepID=A0ABY7W3V4_9BACI|nr:hypothetical protein [Shouchella hunanensis]WDF02746.1 hypothetical protein PQ477_14720 [Shouchella hunanensis]